MPIRNKREYRSSVELNTNEEEFIVEGYATTFDDPYVLYNFDGIDYFEQVSKKAFDNAKMNDVIMQYDHQGMVYARQKNGTLVLNADDHGLHVRADLSKTSASRELYEAIKSGLVSEMSFAFTVEEESYNNETRTRTIEKIKKVYDVSAVSIPANPSTEISARSFVEGVIEKEKAERLRAEAERRESIKALCRKEI